MSHVLPSLAVITLLSIFTVPAIGRLPRAERRVLLASYFGHYAAALLLLTMIYQVYGGSDVLWYLSYGEILADAMGRNFDAVAPEVLKLLLQRDSNLPISVMGAGRSTGTMSAVAALTIWSTGGSTYAASFLVAAASFLGKYALHLAIREHFANHRVRVAIAMTLLPSVVFWTAGIVKEGVAFAGFGWLIFGVHRLIHSRSSSGLVPGALGGLVVGLVKGYILFPVVAGAAVWFYWDRAKSAAGTVRIRPGSLVLGMAVGVLGLIALGEIFPRFAFSNLAEEANKLQGVGQRLRAGSNYEVVDGPAQGLLGQLAYAPLALLTALFRPMIFEVRNAPMALNALETTAVTFLFIRVLWLRSWSAIWKQVRGEPILMFSLVFILLFGVAVGLATTNLGTLSRYRTPLMPFVCLLVVVLLPFKNAVRPTRHDTRSTTPLT